MKTMNRRTFIKSSAAVGLGGLVLMNTGCAEGEGKSMNETTTAMPAEAPAKARALERIGVQLYTVRSILQKDFEGGVEQVAAIGYDEVEFAGYYDHSPAEVKALLDRVGMTAPSVHVGIGLLSDDLDAVVEAAQIIGHQYIVCPWVAPDQRTLDHYKQHAALFNKVGETCKAAGIQFAYHNHDFEFILTDGQVPYDLLLAETDAALVEMELDLYWIKKGGHDATAYFNAHPGRFTLCHVKDMSADESIVPVGTGAIDFGSIFAQSEQAGLKHYFVEHDHPNDPMQSITASYAHLKELRF